MYNHDTFTDTRKKAFHAHFSKCYTNIKHVVPLIDGFIKFNRANLLVKQPISLILKKT